MKNSDGKWFLDTEAGKSEVFARRIGQNELDAIKICRLYVKAQHEYASEDRDGSGGLKYCAADSKHAGKARRFVLGCRHRPPAKSIRSTHRKGEIGRLSARARKAYAVSRLQFSGVETTSAHVAGAKLEYVINGNMTGGFALITCPAAYESSGIMTFVVNQEGRVYQKDLGADTTNIARQIREYNPDSSWTLVKD